MKKLPTTSSGKKKRIKSVSYGFSAAPYMDIHFESEERESEGVSREEIEEVFLKHNVCSWWPKFQFSDCKVNIISDLKAIFDQKLEERNKELIKEISIWSEEKFDRKPDLELQKFLKTLGGRK